MNMFIRKIYRNVISAPLFVAGALLLCFGSCQSSDNTKEGALVTSLPLTAQLESVLSRVGMDDTSGGTFSCYWNQDRLSVYHKYVLNGTAQSIMPLEFATSSTSGTSGTFSYTGSGEYRYNPGSRIYAFSSYTNGGYTASVADDGTTTLTVPRLASQPGTLSTCATFDALYGSAVVNNDTGSPEPLTMHHLFGVLNLHLTSSSFSTSYPVTVTLTSSIASVLPGNSGTATLGADGTLGKQTGSWSPSWSATITPTTSGAVDVYLMTWPFSAINSTLTVSCSDHTGNIYTDGILTLNNFSLAAAQLKSQSLAINGTLFTYDSSKLFAWDATDYQPVTVNTVPTNANCFNYTDNEWSNNASYACKNCPCANEMSWYFSVPCYWDNGSVSGGNTTAYKLADGSTTTAGMWFRKKSGISGFSSIIYSGKNSGTVTQLSTMSTSDIAALNLSSDYFFLPAAGSTNYSTGAFNYGGSNGFYWLSTPDTGTTNGYHLIFSSTSANFGPGNGNRAYGNSLWAVQ